ncbi:MAG: hypothetical protein QMD66_01830 [Actinomycetota bacterium]|nr:hypothetical protein [Actinomycetota bacterium]MDI6821608.1 hypothetical protein [Actinomycetota bacterium]
MIVNILIITILFIPCLSITHDNWDHRVKLEKILHRNKNINYSTCIDGKRACPPEDCGGGLF